MSKTLLNQLRKRKTFSLQADGESMLPLLYPKDQVFYQKINFAKIKTNDLILVYKNSLAFTHRVIYKTNKFLITKGDSNLESDGKIYPRQIIGEITSVKRKNKIIDPEMLYLIQSSLYFKEIVKIINVFERNKINYVFLKGLPVHLYYEKTHPRRIYLDADVLIDKSHHKIAIGILIKLGYKSTDSSLSPTQKKLKDKTVEISFYKLVNGFPVVFDIHLEPAFMMTQIGSLNALYPQKLIDQLTSEFLKTKRKVIINGSTFYLLSSINLIIYLALHFFHHNFTGAFRLELLDKVIRKTRLNSVLINQLINTIHKYRLKNFVSPVFSLLKKYYQTHISSILTRELVNPFTVKPFRVNPLTQKPINLNIFNDDLRTSAGIKRFFLLFLLSPFPFYRKILVFFNPQVIYLVVFTLNSRFKSLLKNNFNLYKLNL